MEDAAAYRFAPVDPFSLLLCSTGNSCPGMAPPTAGWVLSSHSLVKKIPAQTYLQATLMGRHFLRQGSLFPDDCSLHQVEKKANQ